MRYVLVLSLVLNGLLLLYALAPDDGSDCPSKITYYGECVPEGTIYKEQR